MAKAEDDEQAKLIQKKGLEHEANYLQDLKAAAAKGIASRVVIALCPEGLVVGNTGLPFSTGGVRSLRLAYLSPKAAERKQYVGSKGLNRH